MKRIKIKFIPILLILVLFIIISPAHAALQTFTFYGTIKTIDAKTNLIEIQTGNDVFTGTAPNGYVFEKLSQGNPVIAVSLGDKGGEWVFLGKLKSNENILTDIYGDIAFIQQTNCDNDSSSGIFCDISILGEYQFEYSNAPECSNCSGCNCKASKTETTIIDSNNQEITKTLLPGQNIVYEGQDYKVNILFISGETPAYPQCLDQACQGPQPISNFVVNLEPQNANSDDDNSGCFISMVSLFKN